MYRLLVNGRQAGTGPARDARGPVYETHDVTNLVHPGRTVLAALCWAQAGGSFRALMRVTYTDGRTLTFGTDGSWSARSGGAWRPWTGDLNNGVHYYVAPREDLDARREPVGWDSDPNWDAEAVRRAGFRPAKVVGDVDLIPAPHADKSTPLSCVSRRPAVVRRIGSSRWLVDAGIESAYAVCLHIDGIGDIDDISDSGDAFGLEGVRLRLHMGEQVENTDNGSVRFETLSCMRFEDVWTLREGAQTLRHWGYRGFRWLQIDALPSTTAALLPAVLDALDTAIRTGLRLCTDLVPEPDQTGSFSSSNTDLTDVWNLSATGIREGRQDVFMDTPVRERMPYEGDALTHGRCEMAFSRSYEITRATWRYLVRTPGKFTEYRFMMAPLAWEEYLQTGDLDALRADWKLLWQEQAFRFLDGQGYVTKDPKLPGCTDIVDWPQPGELDGFVFTPTNTVVNAWAFQGFRHLALITEALGLKKEHRRAQEAAERLEDLLCSDAVFDGERGAWKDGRGTDHTALHSTLYALSLGVGTPGQFWAGGQWLASHPLREKLPVSPNAATWLLDALFSTEHDEEGLAVLTSHSPTSWWSMIHRWGATQPMEGWSPHTKWNTTFAHPWAAGPLWIIARHVLGVQVDEPGAAHVRIAPQIGNLAFVRGTVPTVRGPVSVSMTPHRLEVHLPANMTGSVTTWSNGCLSGPGGDVGPGTTVVEW